MSGGLLVRGGRVYTPAGMVRADVRVEGGRVSEVARLEPRTGETVVEAEGCWVGPGLVDLHVHFREPGQEWKEDIATGSAAAAAGGFTAVLAMPNTVPAIDSGTVARLVQERGRAVGLVEVVAAGAITEGRAGERLSQLDELWGEGVRLFSDDGDGVGDDGLLSRAMSHIARLGGVLAQHAEDKRLAAGGHLHEGSVSNRLGLPGLPAAAEEAMVARDLGLVRLTACRYHVQHVSTAGTVELVRRAKAEGLPVTSEATPHHLTFDHREALSLDPDFKMYPPLRTPEDVAAVREALVEGVIDAVATDHAPHSAAESALPFEQAPRGVIGLETAVAAVLAAVGSDPVMLFDRMSVRPARIAGLSGQGLPVAAGNPAELVVVDPEATWVAERFASRSANSPWKGRSMRGRVVATVHAGTPTHRVAGR